MVTIKQRGIAKVTIGDVIKTINSIINYNLFFITK